jgi:hypothetical protein
MRVVWKDSVAEAKPWTALQYRGHMVSQYGDGWATNIPGDNNIYFPRDCAMNAIDEILGGKTRKANPKRHELGVKIIGRKDDVS